ncbi:MAG: hypothetical protein V3R54_06250 [Thermodesulfovibrionia bacterium]
MERITEKSTILLPIQMYKVKGYRDGYYAFVQVKFAFLNRLIPGIITVPPDSIIMDLTIKIGIPSRLSRGNYHLYKNEKLLEGPVTSSYIYFTGGQGGLPGFGGTFIFEPELGVSYRINIPAAELKRS